MSFFDGRKKIIGMIHLRPLPGSPLFGGGVNEILDLACADAAILTAADLDGIMLENFGDVPFYKADNAPHTIACITRAALQVKQIIAQPLGINVLRNDIKAALGIALAVDAAFVRVNVHTGAMVTDQGLIEGQAAETLRYRQHIGSNARIMADVAVKHAAPLGQFNLEDMAKDTAYRGLADALIVSGAGTGQPAALETVRRVRQAVPDRPLFLGSGVTAENIRQYMPWINGVIVGTSLKKDGQTTQPIDPQRLRNFVDAFRSAELSVA